MDFTFLYDAIHRPRVHHETSSPQPFRRLSFLRRAALRALPLLLLNGALVQVAQAQTTGTVQTAQPSALSSLVSTLSIFAFFALLIGAVRPKTFGFLFKEKATRGPVCGAFGAAWFFLVILAGPLRPRPVATATTPSPATNVAQRASGKSESASGKDQSAQVRLAESRAKAAEARAERAEKAAASANASASKSSARNMAPEPESDSNAAPEGEKLPSNVSEVDVEGVGKRQIGEVDGVFYSVVQMERAQIVGGEGFSKSADGVFYVLRMRAFNTEKKSHNIRTRGMKLLDDQDREFDPSSEGETALNIQEGKSVWSSQLQPGVKRDFNLVYDAPADASGLKLKIPAGGFGFGKSATLKVPSASE